MDLPPDSARLTGRIAEWTPAQNFGFIDDGTQKIFLHRRDFAEHYKTPEPGDMVLYSIGTDAHGRTCAKNVVHAHQGGRLRGGHFIFLLVLLIAPGLAAYELSRTLDIRFLLGGVAGFSLLTYFVYVLDKRRARQGHRRIAESTLHLLELFGGWPGAFLAQRQLRHKTSKLSYQIVFWLIVAGHQYLAIDWLLDWRLARYVTQAAMKLVQGS